MNNLTVLQWSVFYYFIVKFLEKVRVVEHNFVVNKNDIDNEQIAKRFNISLKEVEQIIEELISLERIYCSKETYSLPLSSVTKHTDYVAYEFLYDDNCLVNIEVDNCAAVSLAEITLFC